MPYDNPKQATAIFMDIARKRGMAAAKAFGRKHSEDMSRGQKGRKARKRRYTPRSR